jgi:hypothetical protein
MPVQSNLPPPGRAGRRCSLFRKSAGASSQTVIDLMNLSPRPTLATQVAR